MAHMHIMAFYYKCDFQEVGNWWRRTYFPLSSPLFAVWFSKLCKNSNEFNKVTSTYVSMVKSTYKHLQTATYKIQTQHLRFVLFKFYSKVDGLQLATLRKLQSLTKIFKGFYLFFRNINFKVSFQTTLNSLLTPNHGFSSWNLPFSNCQTYCRRVFWGYYVHFEQVNDYYTSLFKRLTVKRFHFHAAMHVMWTWTFTSYVITSIVILNQLGYLLLIVFMLIWILPITCLNGNTSYIKASTYSFIL